MSRDRRIRNRKKNKLNKNTKVIKIGILLLLILFISVIFSILNIGNDKIIKGVKIGNVDVSDLSMEEATNKVNTYYKEKTLSDINVEYKEMQEIINIEQLNPSIDIDKIVKEAMLIGKSGNIIKDNYQILFTLVFKNNLKYNVKLDEKEINKKIEELNSKLPGALQKTNYYIEDENLIIIKGKKGIEINKEEFIKKINETIKKEEKRFEIPVENSVPEEIDIEKIYKEIYKEAKNAYIEENPTQVHAQVNGVDFAISLEQAKQIISEEKEEYVIPLKITIPEITLDDLSKEAFPQILGTFTTTYSASNKNRETNLKLSSEKINGTIIMPEEIFSYNKIVGERTIAKGYKEAAVYSGGKVINGIGGGICQLSSTLYNAVVYANLEIVSRSNHMFLTSYVTAGRDATVSWGTLDFSFKNTRKYPIKVVSIVKNGLVTVEIQGLKEEKEYEVVIENKVTEVIPYQVKYVKDDKLEEGETQIVQYGANGAKSITYKVLKYNGNVVSREILSTDTYSALERIIKIGNKKVQEVNANENEERINPELLKLIKELN